MSSLAGTLLLDKDLLVAYLSEQLIDSGGGGDRAAWWGPVFRKTD